MNRNEYARQWYQCKRLRTNIEKVCLSCKETFIAHDRRTNYCKRGCSNRRRVTLVCWYCQKSYEKAQGRKLESHFCSKLCNSRYRRGPLAANWRGGRTEERALLQGRREYKEWRISVFERDNYTCQFCGDSTGGNLEADHIKPWSLYPELRFDIGNGRTLCVDCHKKTETWGSKCKILKRSDKV